MNILMMTNTYAPHVGGVARSVERFAAAYRRRGHRVLVVAPEFEAMPSHEDGVVRIPAIQHFNGSDFSVVLPIPLFLTSAIESFEPDIVHSHHPFLIGSTALRVASLRELPLVFTHHTLYERYTHYVPGDSAALKRFVVDLSTSYANLCDRVFAPSDSIAGLLRERGVAAAIDVVPTGLETDRFARGDGAGMRAASGIPDDAFVAGHVGRLAPEKNLAFMADALVRFMNGEPGAHVLVVGSGPSEADIARAFDGAGLADRLHLAGSLEGQPLTDAYHAMDVFAFASTSETQGMVLTEAMAAGVPVVALDAPGAREVVVDRRNGRLLAVEDAAALADALRWVAHRLPARRRSMADAATGTAAAFSIERCADTALAIYQACRERGFVDRHEAYRLWHGVTHLIRAEWELLRGMAGATGAALGVDEPSAPSRPVRPDRALVNHPHGTHRQYPAASSTAWPRLGTRKTRSQVRNTVPSAFLPVVWMRTIPLGRARPRLARLQHLALGIQRVAGEHRGDQLGDHPSDDDFAQSIVADLDRLIDGGVS